MTRAVGSAVLLIAKPAWRCVPGAGCSVLFHPQVPADYGPRDRAGRGPRMSAKRTLLYRLLTLFGRVVEEVHALPRIVRRDS